MVSVQMFQGKSSTLNPNLERTSGVKVVGTTRQETGGEHGLDKRTLVILRVSKRKSTTENQLLAMERHIGGLPYTPTVRHITGTSWKKAIPEMQEVLKEVKAGKWDEIHLWRVCRTGRDHEYDVTLWKECVRHNVLLWYVENDYRTDREGDEEEFYQESVFAQKERKLISRRTREGIARTRRNAQLKGRPDPFPGRRPGSLGDRTKKLVRDILEMLSIGKKVYWISERWNINRTTVARIRDMPISELRKKTGDESLVDWREQAKAREPKS